MSIERGDFAYNKENINIGGSGFSNAGFVKGTTGEVKKMIEMSQNRRRNKHDHKGNTVTHRISHM